jgi:hypothetical protein
MLIPSNDFGDQLKRLFLRKYPEVPLNVKNFQIKFNKFYGYKKTISYETARLWLNNLATPNSINLHALSVWLDAIEPNNNHHILSDDFNFIVCCLNNIKLLDEVSRQHLLSYMTYLIQTQRRTNIS